MFGAEIAWEAPSTAFVGYWCYPWIVMRLAERSFGRMPALKKLVMASGCFLASYSYSIVMFDLDWQPAINLDKPVQNPSDYQYSILIQ